jgi:predicted dehydrogenase
VKIAIAGLANSHPYTDAGQLRELLPDVEFIVAEQDSGRRRKFLEQEPGAVEAAGVDEMVALAPDAAIVTVRPPEVGDIVEAFLDAGIPTYVTKPAAVTDEQLRRLDELVRGREHLFLTASVLRFASAMRALPDDVAAAHAIAEHHIDYWLHPDSRWQDEPDVGGGLVPIMGVHAFELLELVLGPTMRVTSCTTARVRDLDLKSPDLATGTAANDYGVLASFEINGMAEGQRYGIEITSEEATHTLQLGQGEDPYGFLTVVGAVVAMAGGAPSPLPWERTHAVLRAVVDARRFAGR